MNRENHGTWGGQAGRMSAPGQLPGGVHESSPVSHHDLVDAGEQAALLSWLPIEYRQLSSGRYAGRFEELALDDFSVIREWQGQAVHKMGMMAPDYCTVSLVYNPNGVARFSQFPVQDTHVYLLPARTEFDVRLPPDQASLFVRIPQAELWAKICMLDERLTTAPRQLATFDTPRQPEFAAALGTVLDLFRKKQLCPVQARRALLEATLLALNDASKIVHGDDPGLHAHRRVLRVVNCAKEYIDASLEAGSVPCMAEICQHTRVSERTLQYSFLQHLGMSPTTYLRTVRLGRVYDALRRPAHTGITVTSAAVRWGFLHLGAFARDYRRMFHERPSETLCRSLGTRSPA